MVTPAQHRIRYIRVGLGNGEDEARQAHKRIEEAYDKLAAGLLGEPIAFETVARAYSEDPETADAGGEYPGWIGESADALAKIMLHPLHDAAAQLEPGEVGKPFGFGGSLYIIQVIERRAPAPLSFEVVAPTIRDLLRKQRHDELSRQLQERLLEDADLVIYRQVLDGYLDELARRQSGEESVPGARGAD